MKRSIEILFCLLTAVFLTACVNETDLFIASSHSLNSSCEIETNAIQGMGSVDLSMQGNENGAYYLGFILQNDLDSSDTGPDASKNRNSFYLRHLELSADLNGQIIEETIDVSGSCAAGSSLNLNGINIIGTEAYKAMWNATQDGEAPKVANITIKAKGKLLGGQWVSSNKYHFPVTFYKSGATADEIPPSEAECVSGGGTLNVISGSECSAIPYGQDNKFAICEYPEVENNDTPNE